MSAAELLSSLAQQGVELWAEGERLRYRAARQALTPALLAELAAHKAELLAVLQRRRQVELSAALPPIVPDPARRHEPFPLNDMQQAYWIGRSAAFELGNLGPNSYVELDYKDVDLERLADAWQVLIARHDMLRAVVLPDGQQRILPHVPPYPIEVLDLHGESAETIEAQLQAVREQMAHVIFQPERWPLFEVRATRIDEQRVRVHISRDLLITDGRSSLLLAQELFQVYRAGPATLCPLTLSFRDYVLALAALREHELYQNALRYWRNRLDSLPPAPDLPLARSPGSISEHHLVRRAISFDQRQWATLRQRAARLSLTPSGVLCAAFARTIAAWSTSPRFTLNVMFSNRLPLHSEVGQLVGNFSSTILLAVESTAASFDAWARQLQEQLWSDLSNSIVSGVQVLRELNRRNGTTRAAMPIVFSSGLALSGHAPAADTAPVAAQQPELIYTSIQTPQVFLEVQVLEQAGELMCIWNAVEELFPADMLRDMFDAYCALLRRLIADETSWQEHLRQMLPHRQLTLRAAANDTAAELPSGLLHQPFHEQALRQPQRRAVVSSQRTLRYDELARYATAIGRRLRQRGARPNQLVAVVMEKGWEQVAAVLGVLQAGAAYVPIDPRLPGERLQYLLAHGEVALALTQSWLDGGLDWPAQIQRLCVDTIVPDESDAPLERLQTPGDLAYVIYTSGSTGQPKGVMIDHRGARNTIQDLNERFAVGPNDRVLALSSLSFDLSVYDIFGTLAAGGTIVMPDADVAQDPAHWARWISAEQVTIWNSVPALLELLVEYASGQPAPQLDSLRLVLLSGDWIPLSLPDRFRALRSEGSSVAVISLGGATEAAIWSIAYPIERVDPAWKSIPYGRPLHNQQFHVLNDALDPCPVWVPGQLYIGGGGLALGYWRDPEKTASRFIPNPFGEQRTESREQENQEPKAKNQEPNNGTTEQGEHGLALSSPSSSSRLYKTGDLGRYLPDGTIEFLGREDFQVKIQGYRIELGEIEAALEQHPAVRAAVVTAAGEPQGIRWLVAYVVGEQRTENKEQRTTEQGNNEAKEQQHNDSSLIVHPSSLRQFLARKLPEYMVPTSYVLLDALPLTPNGKVDRRALPQPGALGVRSGSAEFVAPRDALEQQLSRIWSEVLRAQQIGVRDNFFDFGGHSMLALHLTTRIRETLGQALPLATLFQAPTIEQLADLLRQRGATIGWSALVPIQRGDDRAPLFCVHPVGGNVLCYRDLARQLGPEQPVYGLQAQGLDGRQPPLSAIEAMAAHYLEAIRTVQPEGPYLLAGWSMGGIIAFEMAQQLRQQGQAITLLALIDARRSALDGPHDEAEATLLRMFVEDLGLSAGDWAEQLTTIARLEPEQQLAALIEHAHRAQVLPAEIGLPEARQLFEVFKANVRAMRSYRPQPYPAGLSLLRASQQPLSEQADPTLGWTELAGGVIELHTLPGDHYTIMREPQVRQLAAVLRGALSLARSAA